MFGNRVHSGFVRCALFAMLALPACQHAAGRGARIAECPGELLSTQEIEADFRSEMRVHFRAESEDVALRVVAEKLGTSLVVIGLSPLGAKLFTVVQTNRDVAIDALPGRVVRVPPIDVLRELHRMRFLEAGVPPGEHGRAELVRDGTRILEIWRDGVLAQRSFSRVSGSPSGEVTVVYAAPTPGVPPRAVIQNDWCGYSVSIETLDEETLR